MKGHTHRRRKEGADLHRPTNKQIDIQTYVHTRQTDKHTNKHNGEEREDEERVSSRSVSHEARPV